MRVTLPLSVGKMPLAIWVPPRKRRTLETPVASLPVPEAVRTI